ncbi:MAG: translation initiation factor IF-3 [Chitinivibrionales bacterium]|nr:translation initiation factor IF-3 [Chitinivibrionales bacterium]
MNNRFRSVSEDSTRINERIRVPKARVVGEDGEFLGIMPIAEAIQKARDAGLDLVEIAPNADPPVCKIIDYGKFKYEKSKKAKEAKKKQHIMHLKEIKMHPKTEQHDYNFKMEHAREFLIKGDRVKATIVFRGREIMYTEFGRQILDKLDADLAPLATVEQARKMEGRNLGTIYVPDKIKIKEFLRRQETEKKRSEETAAQPQ